MLAKMNLFQNYNVVIQLKKETLSAGLLFNSICLTLGQAGTGYRILVSYFHFQLT